MSKTSTIVIAVVCLALGAAAALFWFQPSPTKIDVNRLGQGQGSASTSPAAAAPQVVTRTFNEDSANDSIQVDYPELQGLADAGIQSKVNDALKGAAYSQIASFRANNASGAIGTDGANASSTADFRSMLNASFTMWLLTKSFFSASVAYSDYSAGAAHPDNYFMTLNYNLKTGDAVTIDQVLRGVGGNVTLSSLATQVQKQLIDRFGNSADERQLIDAGAAPTSQNYAHFVLDQDGLTVLFDPYQVAAGAAGAPQVKIAYADLAAGGSGASASASSTLWWLQ